MNKALSAFVALLLVLPAAASAQQSNADLQAQAQLLLQQVAQLQAQLAAQQGGGSAAANANSLNPNPSGAINVASAAGTGSAACPNIGRILKRGSTGDDVTRLQQYLALDPSVYPEGTVSGYFGALTERAVQRWQSKYNIVSSGSPSTTGWGQVGPRTAAAIALLCQTGGSSPVGGYIQVSPISGNAPLTVTVIATVNSTNSCASAIYQLNWGDNSNPVSIPVSANVCTQISQTYTHTYTAGGTYQITLSSGAHQTGATITVYGSGASPTPSPTPTPPAVPSDTFSASPTSGNAPLTVTFSGVVTGKNAGWCSTGCSSILVFGDGQQGAVPLPTSQTAAQNYSIQHTYTSNGTYTATLYQGAAGSGRPTVGSATIIVGGGGGGTATFNAPSLTTLVGGNPMAVSLIFDFSCSYSVNWGDTVVDTQVPAAGTCTTGTASKTLNHTYTAGGNYTITLTRGSQTNTIGVNISQ
jgi:PKD repeat protein